MKTPDIHPQILVKSGICTGVLALLVLAVLLPQKASIADLRDDIDQVHYEIRRQDALTPTYVRLRTILNEGLPQAVPAQNALAFTREGIRDIPVILRELADDQGAMATAIVPDPASIASGGDAVSVDCTFWGPLSAQRAVLLELGALKSLSHIEKITLREDRKQTYMQLKAWLKLEG